MVVQCDAHQISPSLLLQVIKLLHEELPALRLSSRLPCDHIRVQVRPAACIYALYYFVVLGERDIWLFRDDNAVFRIAVREILGTNISFLVSK